ncbi:PilN domain-containing protein [Geobacter pelophilus]|uniref:PilN domain-containing protein n=1 Tax=Geoanaerobacter pelophilus TaxID=60036 RepID=A0AAW4L6A4_9BACT|nr:PilN domain-containing protein [Geoanaerobacter pelophilus]MBT0662786.1 PilN domain-containing protein [Geoanaerobacter pelophilus]
MRLTINLATRTYINRGQLNLLFAVVFVILIAFSAVNIIEISSNWGEADRINSELRALEQKSSTKGRNVPEAEYQNLVSRIRFANGVIYRKSFNWLGLLEMLENVVPEGISLSAIEPDTKKKALKLTGTTSSFANLRKLLENMEGSSNFSDIYLLSQNDTKVGEAQKGITFSISCQVKI